MPLRLRRIYLRACKGPVNTIRANSDKNGLTGCAKQTAANTGCIFAASDKAVGKSGHISLLSPTVVPPHPSDSSSGSQQQISAAGLVLVWPDFPSQRCRSDCVNTPLDAAHFYCVV